jgi:hypothetical protein
MKSLRECKMVYKQSVLLYKKKKKKNSFVTEVNKARVARSKSALHISGTKDSVEPLLAVKRGQGL